MKTYKAPDNTLHVIEPEFAHLLPAGCVQITEEEAEAIRIANTPVPVPPTPQEQIDTIERNTLMNRATREFLMGLAEEKAAALGLTPEQLYEVNFGYKAVKDIDTQIVALRALMVVA